MELWQSAVQELDRLQQLYQRSVSEGQVHVAQRQQLKVRPVPPLHSVVVVRPVPPLHSVVVVQSKPTLGHFMQGMTNSNDVSSSYPPLGLLWLGFKGVIVISRY